MEGAFNMNLEDIRGFGQNKVFTISKFPFSVFNDSEKEMLLKRGMKM